MKRKHKKGLDGMEFINTKNIKLTIHENLSCIYIIRNIIDGKVYIGQTTNFRKRLSDYKNYHKKKINPRTEQPIKRALREYGTDAFTIDVFLLCEPEYLRIYEDACIEYFKSYDPTKGYNAVRNNSKTTNTELTRKRKSLGHLGLKDSVDTKQKKSNVVIAVKDKTLLVCDSGKLFGDYVGVGKDMVKNGLRQPTKVKEYMLYYDDFEKRQDIRKKMLQKKCIRNKEYMVVLNILDKIEDEGVETIYDYFSNVYLLKYDDNEKYRLEDFAIVLKPEPEYDSDIDYDNQG